MDFRKVTPDTINYIKSASVAVQARLYIKLTKVHRLASQNVWFNQQCKREHLIPKYINLRSNTNSRSADIAIKKAQFIWLNEESRRWFSIRDNLKLHLKILHSELSYTLHNIEFDLLDQKARLLASQEVYKKYVSQCSKLRVLRRESGTNNNIGTQRGFHEHSHTFYPRIKNLSNVQLSNDEVSLLNKGLKYNLKPQINQRTLEGLAVDVEIAVVSSKKDHLTKNLATNITANQIKTAVRQSNRVSSNPEYHIYKTLSQKITENNLIVSKADKGNTVVVMERSNYIHKVEEIIHNDDFVLLQSDPTKRFASEIKEAINSVKFIFSDNSYTRNSILEMNPRSPCLYGLPKIHKESMPMRPVVSYIGAPAYKLAKKLNSLLRTKSSFNPKYSLRNSLDLINKIQSVPLPRNAKLLSLDVDSLFTNVPCQETLTILKEHLEKQRLHPGEIEDLILLTTFCMKQNYFRFNDQYYRQREGLAMGSPLSPLMADIFMDNFENKYLVHDRNILYYYRYVDDILICWTGTKRQLDILFNKINNIHHKIKFKLELENNDCINFLDLTIMRVQGKHEFQIFRKPTHTDTVIHASSCHPWQHKMAAFNSYVHRLITIPLSEVNFKKELNILYHIATSNGYKRCIIDGILKNKINKIITSLLYPVPEEKENRYNSSLIYLGSVSERICKTLKKHDMHVAFNTNNSLRMLCNGKDKFNKQQKSGVYKLDCGECNSTYIGQTGRSFNTRYKEHISAYRNNHPEKSHFAKHLIDSGHSIPDNHTFNILHICKKSPKLSVLEQLEITKHNKDNTLTLLNEQVSYTTSPLLNIFSNNISN
jgi:hypothetical protein